MDEYGILLHDMVRIVGEYIYQYLIQTEVIEAHLVFNLHDILMYEQGRLHYHDI